MPLFVCDAWGCIENTATCDFWTQHRSKLRDRRCSQCRTGTWHNRFPRRPHAGEAVIWPRPPSETDAAEPST